MKVAQSIKSKQVSRVSLEAGDDLLRAIKKRMMRTKGKIDEDELRRRGYSDALIERLKAL